MAAAQADAEHPDVFSLAAFLDKHENDWLDFVRLDLVHELIHHTQTPEEAGVLLLMLDELLRCVDPNAGISLEMPIAVGGQTLTLKQACARRGLVFES